MISLYVFARSIIMSLQYDSNSTRRTVVTTINQNRMELQPYEPSPKPHFAAIQLTCLAAAHFQIDSSS
jgi:hypothetical protein